MIDFLASQIRGEIPRQKFNQIFDHLHKIYQDGEDPWGLNLAKAQKTFELIYPFYKNYFKTRVFGREHVEDVPYMVIANHSGQIAIDGMLITTAFVMEMEKPRILRAMMERFLPKMPFIGMWAAEGGAVLGDRQNCLNLLNRGESVLAFPEGVRGVSKSTADYYKLQKFSSGFFRLCLSAGVDVLPIAVVGAEEIFPWVYQAKGLAKLLGLPALPLSPLYLPLPSPIDIYIGEPYQVPRDLSPESPDALIDEHVRIIERKIQQLTQEGLEKRRKFWASVKEKKK